MSAVRSTGGRKLAGSALDAGTRVVNIAEVTSRADRALQFVDR
jgi:hypothetical protein